MQDSKPMGGGFPFASVDRPLAGSPIIPDELQQDVYAEFGNHFIDEIQAMYPEDAVDTKYSIASRPYDRNGPPARGCFSGVFNFHVAVSNSAVDRRQYAHSAEMNKVYLPMLAELPIEFKWDRQPSQPYEFWIRATVILAGPEHQESRVLRCHNHRVPNDASNRDVLPYIHPHILRSARQSDDVVYCGNETDDQHWLSVAFSVKKSRLDDTGVLTHVYRFCCKHSCTSGINRRKIEVLFTLEDAMGEIYGRKSIGVRVCSCPKRDMEKDYKEMQTRRSGSPPRKRQMIVRSQNGPTYVIPNGNPITDNKTYKLNLEIFGRANYELALTNIYNATVAELVRLPNGSTDRLKHLKTMETIQELRKNLNGAVDSP